MKIDFQHRHAAHCESGVTSNLFAHYGLPVSEALVFGVGAGLFFTFIPFLKVYSLPMLSFRHLPGRIFQRAAKRLGVRFVRQRYRRPERSMEELDRLLAQDNPVGIQVGVYWLPFFPPKLRFHFNGHNMVVYGKEEDDYLISDPVLDQPVRCPSEDLMRARYSRGPLAPKGTMYYPLELPSSPALVEAIWQGIREVSYNMTRIPVPLFGVKAIRYLARHLQSWPQRYGPRKTRHYLSHFVRMQEEIGTGGAGFRFIWAAFLQEAAPLTGQEVLLDYAKEMTRIGDRWRDIALICARLCKGRASAEESHERLGELLLQCADEEERVFRDLYALSRRRHKAPRQIPHPQHER